MPAGSDVEKAEQALQDEADKHPEWDQQRKNRYVYGALRRLGWKPGKTSFSEKQNANFRTVAAMPAAALLLTELFENRAAADERARAAFAEPVELAHDYATSSALSPEYLRSFHAAAHRMLDADTIRRLHEAARSPAGGHARWRQPPSTGGM